MRSTRTQTWVVYSMPLRASDTPMRFICEQSEWDAMNLAKPGYYSLIQAGIENEGEAERLARGTAGEAKSRTAKSINTLPKLPPPAKADQPAAS